MALTDKYSVLGVANSYSGALAKAAKHCDAAAKAIIPVHAEVLENWQGESGSIMALKLDALRVSINKAYAKLASASSQASADGWRVYSSWPEEETEE